MKRRGHVAPSYAELEPLTHAHSAQTERVPVYDNLVDRLLGAHDHADETVAHVLAVCSAYAYGDAETLATTMAHIGLERNHCLMIEQYVDAMFITSTSFLLQSSDGRVAILCYRGTPPTSLVTWLTDANLEPTHIDVPLPSGSGEGCVHGGFYRNVRATRHLVVQALEQALDGQSVRPGADKLAHGLEALYITGHSLGGASAALLALLLATEPAYRETIVPKLRAVYTFGAPMVMSSQLADECNACELLGKRVIRYVYANDIIPQLPPKASGAFKHFGVGYQYQPKARAWEQNDAPRRQLRSLFKLAVAPLTLFAGDLELTRHLPLRASIRDHLPQYYIEALTPEEIRSEFGVRTLPTLAAVNKRL